MAKKPKTLKEIAIELLEKYEASETTAIWEYSPNIRLSEEMLKKEVAKYRKMIDKADRKTENSSEKPNNCEECKHWNDTKDGCADRHGCRTTTEDCSTVPTSSKMEQVDEPQKCSVNGRPYDCGNCEYHKCTADEPQAERIKTPDYCVPSGYEPITQMKTKNSNLTFEKADEPQTERSSE